MVQTVKSAVAKTNGWRAFAASAALAVVGALASVDWSQVLSAANASKVMAALGIAGMIVRAVFGNTPVGVPSTSETPAE